MVLTGLSMPLTDAVLNYQSIPLTDPFVSCFAPGEKEKTITNTFDNPAVPARRLRGVRPP